jgi:hypothetical protein
MLRYPPKADKLRVMVHQFHLTSAIGKDREGHKLRSGVTTFTAETNLGPSPQLGVPEKITGKLLSKLTPEQIIQLSALDAEVGFEGRGYKFSKAEKDGSFELSIIQQP